MEVKLKVLGGSKDGHTIKLTQSKFMIGRAVDCHLKSNSDLISRYHCALIVEGTFVGIRDFGSKNGTFVNGHRIEGEPKLKAGDEICIGPLRFELLIESTAKPGLAKTKGTKIIEGDIGSAISGWLSGGADKGNDTVVDVVASHEIETQPVEPILPIQSKKKQVVLEKNSKPGRLPKVAEVKATSSGAAAAEMLKEMQRKRSK